MDVKFAMPELTCPFADDISPHADHVDNHVIDWANQFELLRDDVEAAKLSGTKVGRLAARTTPRATSPDLKLLADWQTWLFLFDHQHSDEPHATADLNQLSH